MKLESLDQHQLERLIKDVLAEKLQHMSCDETIPARRDPSGVMAVDLPAIHLNGNDRLDTGHPTDHVLTKDVYTLEESPRLGCGLMEMRDTTFKWHLDYDEIDYIIDGTLTIIVNGCRTTAHAGQCIYIPKGTSILFSVEGFARFLYVTYPANWQNA